MPENTSREVACHKGVTRNPQQNVFDILVVRLKVHALRWLCRAANVTCKSIAVKPDHVALLVNAGSRRCTHWSHDTAAGRAIGGDLDELTASRLIGFPRAPDAPLPASGCPAVSKTRLSLLWTSNGLKWRYSFQPSLHRSPTLQRRGVVGSSAFSTTNGVGACGGLHRRRTLSVTQLHMPPRHIKQHRFRDFHDR